MTRCSSAARLRSMAHSTSRPTPVLRRESEPCRAWLAIRMSSLQPPAGLVSFPTVTGRHAGGGKFYKVGYNPTNVSLGAFQALGGDADGNLTVDITDFNTLAGNFGSTGVEWTDADFDANDVVDITDFNTLAANFGPYGGPGDGPGQVPEPSAICLLVVGLTMGWCLIPRRRSKS